MSRNRRGVALLEPNDRRGHCVSVRFNAEELGKLDQARSEVRMQRGQFLRSVFLKKPMTKGIPAINQEAWVELARAASNLNQLAKHLNGGGSAEIDEIMNKLGSLRNRLIGVKFEHEG